MRLARAAPAPQPARAVCAARSCLARDDVDASLGTAVSLVEPEELPYLLDLSLYLGRPVAAVPSEADSGGARAWAAADAEC